MRIILALINMDEEPTGTISAFKKAFGPENVRVFDYCLMNRQGRSSQQINQDLLQLCAEWKPDIVHSQLQESQVITPQTLGIIKQMLHSPFLSIWMGDWRASVPPYTAQVSSACDLVLISSVGQIPMYKDATSGRDVRYWQIGVGWKEDMDYDEQEPALPHERIPEVVFSGRYYSGSGFPGADERLAVCQALAGSGLDFAVVGSGFPPSIPCVGQSPRRFQKWIYKKAKVSIGVNNANATEMYYSERQLQAMASGTPHVCWRIPGLEREFDDGVDCIMFDTPTEAVQKTKELLADEIKRVSIGDNGRRKIKENHTWDSRVSEYRAMLIEKGVTL